MLEAHFLPYGRVDAVLIGCDGEWVFIDSGYRSDGKQAVTYMTGLGIEKLDAYIATHRHRNHVGGGPVIIDKLSPGVVYTADERMQNRLKNLASGKEEKNKVLNTPFRVLTPGDVFYISSARFECLGPKKLNKYSVGAVGENYNSLILRVDYGARSMLLTGDTSGSKLNDINGGKVACEVLKNPHHNGALGEKLLARIAPKYVVICNGSPPAGYYQNRISSVGARMLVAGKKGDGRVILKGRFSGSDWSVEK